MSDCGDYVDFSVINEWADGEQAYELRKCNRCGFEWEERWFADLGTEGID